MTEQVPQEVVKRLQWATIVDGQGKRIGPVGQRSVDVNIGGVRLRIHHGNDQKDDAITPLRDDGSPDYEHMIIRPRGIRRAVKTGILPRGIHSVHDGDVMR
ncbi:MAG TPA: hypothetical protein VLB73_05085 [Patescibacteria group bacterium]|nr:hypothetical protein [Patescibacteria group bacterium]